MSHEKRIVFHMELGDDPDHWASADFLQEVKRSLRLEAEWDGLELDESTFRFTVEQSLFPQYREDPETGAQYLLPEWQFRAHMEVVA